MTGLDKMSMKILQDLDNSGADTSNSIRQSIKAKQRDVAARMILLRGRGLVKQLKNNDLVWTLTPKGRKFYRDNR